MNTDRWVVLGLAPARTAWFATVAQWANAGTLPVEYVKCLSIEELRVRLRSGRPVSAVLLDAQMPGIDRDLLAVITEAGSVTVIVRGEVQRERWEALGAGAVVAELRQPAELLDALAAAPRVVRAEIDLTTPAQSPLASATTAAALGRWKAKVAAVCGPGGTGASTVAMALAQGLGADARNGDLVVLADLARRAELGMLHDATDIVPAVEELVEVHRFGSPSSDDVRHLTFHLPDHGYSLLLGLRRPTAWSTIPPHAFATAFEGLRRAFRVVVCDVDADFEGEGDGGSADVEDRNVMARTAAASSDLVFAVGLPGTKGVHSLVRVVRELLQLGVPDEAIQPVVNRAPRSPRARAELAAAVASLLPDAHGLASPVFLPERRVDECVRDARSLPAAIVAPLVGAWRAGVGRAAHAPVVAAINDGDPVRITPGSLGHWADDDSEII